MIGNEVSRLDVLDLFCPGAAIESDRDDCSVAKARLGDELGLQLRERRQHGDDALEARRLEAGAGVCAQMTVDVEPAAEPLERHQIGPTRPLFPSHLLLVELPFHQPLVSEILGDLEAPTEGPRAGREGVPPRLVGVDGVLYHSPLHAQL